MADQAFLVFVAIAMLSVLGLWLLIAFGSLTRAEADGQPILAVAVLMLCSCAPVLFWITGTHVPVFDYAKLRTPTAGQAIVGQMSVLALVVLVAFGAAYVLKGQAYVDSRGRAVWACYLGFAVGAILAMIAGTRPSLRYEPLLGFAAMTVLFVSVRGHPDRWVTMSGRLLLVYVWASLATAVVRPDWAFEATSRATLVLGVRPRLVGITANPNALGPLAAMALLLVAVHWRGPWRVINAMAAGAVLVMTDSRMSIAGAVAGLLVVYVGNRGIGRVRRTVVAACLVAIPLLLVASATDPMERLAALSDGSLSSHQVTTLGGRLDVWKQTLDEWRVNPLFGYGPSLWSPEYRQQFGLSFDWVGQAHNQWIQTLGEAGLVGLAGLVIYVGSLLRAALLTLTRSRGLTGALVVLLLVRMLSESPLRNPTLDVVTLLHVVTFTVVLAYSRPVPDPRLIERATPSARVPSTA